MQRVLDQDSRRRRSDGTIETRGLIFISIYTYIHWTFFTCTLLIRLIVHGIAPRLFLYDSLFVLTVEWRLAPAPVQECYQCTASGCVGEERPALRTSLSSTYFCDPLGTAADMYIVGKG